MRRKLLQAMLFWIGFSGTAAAGPQDALLIVAHGARQPEWNQRIFRLAEQVQWPGPVGVAFLMEAAPEHRLATVAARRDAAGIERIIVVPLLVSTPLIIISASAKGR